MRLSHLSALLIGLLTLCFGEVLLASEADELRDRAKAMRKEASVLADQGNMEQAERLQKEALKLSEAAEHLELKDKTPRELEIEKGARHLKVLLRDLLAKQRKLKEANAGEQDLTEVREQIAGTERKLHALNGRRIGTAELPPEFRPQVEKLEATTRRIHHLRIAAENLKLAEVHDLAGQLMEKAEAMEGEVHEAKKKLAAEMQKRHGGEFGQDMVQDLRAEIERLRAEVKELRAKIENRVEP